jgi:hypothetical protein
MKKTMFTITDRKENKFIFSVLPELEEWIKIRHKDLYNAIIAKDSIKINQFIEKTIINFNPNSNIKQKSFADLIKFIEKERIKHLDNIKRKAVKNSISKEYCFKSNSIIRLYRY